MSYILGVGIGAFLFLFYHTWGYYHPQEDAWDHQLLPGVLSCGGLFLLDTLRLDYEDYKTLDTRRH